MIVAGKYVGSAVRTSSSGPEHKEANPFNTFTAADATRTALPANEPVAVPARESIFPDQDHSINDPAEQIREKSTLPGGPSDPSEPPGPAVAIDEGRVEVVIPSARVTGPAGPSPRCTGAFCQATKDIGDPCDCHAECNNDLRCDGEERCEDDGSGTFVCVEGAESFPNATGGCLEDMDMPGGSIPGNSGITDRCQPGEPPCKRNDFSACLEPELCKEVTCTSQFCTDNYCGVGGDCSDAGTRMFCFQHPGGDLGQRCVDEATRSFANPIDGPGDCTMDSECPSGTCILDFVDSTGFCACDNDSQCVNNDCNEARRTCRTTGYECDFTIIPGDTGAGDCELVIGTCCVPGVLAIDAPECIGTDIIDCNGDPLGNGRSGTWTSDRETNRNNSGPIGGPISGEIGCLNNCARYRSGVRGPDQGNAVGGGGNPGVVNLGPTVEVPCGAPPNGFESIGDDYVLAGGVPIVLERFSFTGGTDSGGSVVIQFYDTSMNLAAELVLAVGRIKGIRTWGDRQNPLYLNPPGADPMNQPIIPAAGFIVMRSPTFGTHGARDSQGHWFTTNAAVDIGANDPNSMWINGVVGDFELVIGTGNKQVLSFELRGVPLEDTPLRTPGGAEACCDPAAGCTDTLPWLCSTCQGGAADGEFCTRDIDCRRCTLGANDRCWSDDQCANKSQGTCDAAPTCGGSAFLSRETACQQDSDCPESSPGAGDATCVFYGNALALPIDEFPPAGFCLNKCNANPCVDGACCLADGTCVIETSQVSCDALPGTWQGFGESCDPNCCPAGSTGGDFCWQATPYVLSVPATLNEMFVQTITTTTADSVVGPGTGPIGGRCEFLTCSTTGDRCQGVEGSSCDGGAGVCEHRPCAWQVPAGHPLACGPGICQSDGVTHCRSEGDCPGGAEEDLCQGFEECERLDCGDPNIPSLGWRVAGSDPVMWESFTLTECALVTIDYCCTDDNPNVADGAARPSGRFFDTCEGSPSRQKFCEGLKEGDTPTGTECTSDADCPEGTCSLTGGACHDVNECPLGTCSGSGQGCRLDGDCPVGETCTDPETCIAGQRCEPLRDFCGPLDDEVVEPICPDPDGVGSCPIGWKCGGGDSNWAQIYKLPPGIYYIPIRALRTCDRTGASCFSDGDCVNGGICQIHEHEYQIHITTEKCLQSVCCRLGEICEGTDVNNENTWCLDSTAGQCATSLAVCSSDFDCAAGVCSDASADSCTVDADCTRMFPNSVPGFVETCQSDGTCAISCHQSYEPPTPVPLGFNCPVPEICVGFERCILDDCPESVCNDDPGGNPCNPGNGDDDCTVGSCSGSGNPCHSDIDCPPGECTIPIVVKYCRDDVECTLGAFCTAPAPETCIGGAICDPHQCTPDQPLCSMTDQRTCENDLRGFWLEGVDACTPPGTSSGENVCFVGACCTDDTADACKDDAQFNSVEGCAGFGGASLFVPGALCVDDPCPVCEIEDQAHCQFFDIAQGFISRCDIASGTSIPSWRCADDFVSATTGSLDRVCWWPAFAPTPGNPECSQPGEAPADAFRVRIYPDLGHIPDEGAELGPIGGQPLNIDFKGPVVGRVWQFSAPLDEPVVLVAGECYWLEITGEGTPICDVFWSTSSKGNNHAMQDFNFPDFGRYTSEDAANADFAWCVSTGIESTGPLEAGCGQVLGACCACGCEGEDPICQEISQDACGDATGCTGFSGKWKIYRRCDTDGNGTGDGDKCWEDTDCDSSPGAGDGVCTVPEGGQCGINPCGVKPPNDDCENAIVISHPDNDFNNDIVVCNDIRCATTDGPPTNCGTNPGDLSFDVWYRYMAPGCGNVTIQTCNSLPIYDGFGAVYRASDFTPANECAEILAGNSVDDACNDDGCGVGGPWSLNVCGFLDELFIRMGGWFDGDPSNYARAVDEGCFELHFTPANGCDCVGPLGSPQTAPYPHDRRKNRYISFDPNKAENDGTTIAFKVELTAITLGSCNGGAGDPAQVDFCRANRGADDCNTCSNRGNACISLPIDCAPDPPPTCDPTGETCVNDAPNSGGSNVGKVWWVGPERNGVHLLVSMPFRLESADWPNPVHVGDCEVVPEATYKVTAVLAADETESAGSVSVETTLFAPISSSWWGDCVGALVTHCGPDAGANDPGDIREPRCDTDADCSAPNPFCRRAWELPNGSVNFDDVNAAMALTTPGPTSVAPEKTWVDVHGNASGTPGSQNFDPPNFILSFSDIANILSGFAGFPYKGYDPADCPDEPDWP